jgi:7,8-dihydroneopterin aldolase/epimerase/oxygenase
VSEGSESGGRDILFVRGIEARALIGVDAWEREGPQTVVIDLEFACDAAHAARRDEVEDAVNYRTVAKAALAFAESSRFRLVETLAERLAERLMAECRLPWIRLRVVKPGAVRFSRECGVEIERGRRPS